MRLTKTMIDKAFYEGGPGRRYVLWDEDIPGFGLRVFPTGKKSFVLSYRACGRKHLYTIGQYGVFTLEQARREAVIKLGTIAQGADPLAERRRLAKLGTIRELCGVYLDKHSKIHKRTWREDERRINSRILPVFGNIRAAGLTVVDAATLHLKIGEKHKYEANRVIELLRSILEKGKEWGFLEPTALNPCRKVKRFKEKKRDRWVTHDELPRVAAAIDVEDNIYVRSAIWLYLMTGVRKSELLKSKWSNVDWSRKELRLEDTKAGNDHVIPLSSAAIEILRAIPRLAGNEHIIPGLKPGAHLVGIMRPWGRIRKRAGVTDVRLHDLRRTVGSWLAQDGASLHLIGRVLNHSSNETTRVYARFGQDSVRNALEAHGAKLLGRSQRVILRSVK